MQEKERVKHYLGFGNSEESFGIEIENEFIGGDANFLYNPMKLWSIKKDGSLRGDGYEFVSNILTRKTLPTALFELEEMVNGSRFTFSSRTSTHIHVNMREATLENIKAYAYLYTILEPLIFKTVKASRLENNFCLSSCGSRSIFLRLGLKKDARLINLLQNLAENNWKYSSLNLAPLRNLGTVECRVFHSTFNSALLTNWVNVLLAVRKIALEKSVLEIKESFTKYRPGEFLLSLGGDTYMFLEPYTASEDELNSLLREGFLNTPSLF